MSMKGERRKREREREREKERVCAFSDKVQLVERR